MLLVAAVRLNAAETNLPSLKLEIVSPLDYGVVQRESASKGHVVIAGNMLGGGKSVPLADTIEAKFEGHSTFGTLTREWERLPCDSRVAAFRGDLTVPAGGWYRLKVRALRHSEEVAATYVEHVGVGEVFVIAGQSNSANYGEERQRTKTGLVSAFSGESWQLANDPQPGAGGTRGSFTPVYGDVIVSHMGVPVGIVATGIGSTSVREWLPAGTRVSRLPTLTRNVITVGPGAWEINGKIFRDFTARMKQFGSHGFRAVLWHQGESDAGQADADCTLPGELYKDYLDRLIRESRKEIGWNAPWFVAQVSSHGLASDRSPDIRAAQKALWEAGVALEGPDTDALTGKMREHNGAGVHFSSAGLQEHGRLWAERVIPWLQHQLDESKREGVR
jgi:Carbohydrate esterase, sialic acid-specific acetylesterase